jgi:hypothetical protein
MKKQIDRTAELKTALADLRIVIQRIEELVHRHVHLVDRKFPSGPGYLVYVGSVPKRRSTTLVGSIGTHIGESVWWWQVDVNRNEFPTVPSAGHAADEGDALRRLLLGWMGVQVEDEGGRKRRRGR